MIATRSLVRIAPVVLAIGIVVTTLSTRAATVSTRYFIDIPGGSVPVAIAAFSSDARADVAEFSASGTTTDPRPARGKFSIVAANSPFTAGQTLDTLIVLAQTPQKLVTLTFSGVTIDAADPTSGKNERITFEAANYSVKYGEQKPASGQTQP